jgi:hypothetical protein
MKILKKNRIEGAKNKRLDKHRIEMLELNQLLCYIKKSNLENIQSIKGLIFKRQSELDIALNSNPHKEWTTTEIRWLKDNYHKCTARELAIDLKRSVDSVKRTINKYKITKK